LYRYVTHKRKQVVGREKDMLAKLAKFQTNLVGSLKAEARKQKEEGEGGEGGEKKEERDGAIGVSRFVAQGLYYAEDDEEEDDSVGLCTSRMQLDPQLESAWFHYFNLGT
jgi:hypothetical protein